MQFQTHFVFPIAQYGAWILIFLFVRNIIELEIKSIVIEFILFVLPCIKLSSYKLRTIFYFYFQQKTDVIF